MTFKSLMARPFRLDQVQTVPPYVVGVYGLFNADACVYVGRGQIRDRLLSHLRGDNPAITLMRPDRFVIELTLDYERRERELIFAYRPLVNQRIG